MNEVSTSEIYKEQYAHFRSMNDILYKIPPLFTAVLGGLWYFATTNLGEDKWIACVVFAFAGIASTAFINVMQRFKMAFSAYLDNLNRMDGALKVSLTSSRLPSAIITVQFLLLVAAIVSAFGAIYAAKS